MIFILFFSSLSFGENILMNILLGSGIWLTEVFRPRPFSPNLKVNSLSSEFRFAKWIHFMKWRILFEGEASPLKWIPSIIDRSFGQGREGPPFLGPLPPFSPPQFSNSEKLSNEKERSSKRRTSFCRGPKRGPRQNGGSMGVIEIVQLFRNETRSGSVRRSLVVDGRELLVGACRDTRSLWGGFTFQSERKFLARTVEISIGSSKFCRILRAADFPVCSGIPEKILKFFKISKKFSTSSPKLKLPFLRFSKTRAAKEFR